MYRRNREYLRQGAVQILSRTIEVHKVPYQIALDIMYSNSPVSHIEDFNQWLVSTCGLTQQEADAYVLYQPKDIPTFLKG